MSHDTVDPHLHDHPFVGRLALLEAFFWVTCYGLFCAFHVAVHGTLQGICIGIASMSSILVLTMFAKKDPNDFWLLLSVVLFALSWGILISVSDSFGLMELTFLTHRQDSMRLRGFFR